MTATGLDDFISILKELPSKYNATKQRFRQEAKAKYAQKRSRGKRAILGNMTQRLFQDILDNDENLPVSLGKPIYEKGQVKPDLCIGDGIAYIEIKKWDDSNSLRSAIFEGYLIKKKIPDTKFYILTGGGDWSGGISYEFYKQHTEIGMVSAVDGWYNAGTLEDLANQLGKDIRAARAIAKKIGLRH
jgi:hypothetical protein